MRRKYAVIWNPSAGKQQKDRLDIVRNLLTNAGADFIVSETNPGKLPAACAGQALQEGCDALIGCGGDGTLNEIGSVVYKHPHAVLGIVPSGSGNDIARSHQLPLDTRAATERILADQMREVDCGFANEHFFMNIASIGFDAEVVHHKTTLPGFVPPSLGYRLSVLLLMLSYKEMGMRIHLNEEVIERPTLLCAVGIGRYYGGGIEILGNAVVDDGLFDTCMIQKVSIPQRLVLLPALGKGDHLDKFSTVRYDRVEEIHIQTDRPTWLNIDGELIPDVKEARFTLHHKGMRLLG